MFNYKRTQIHVRHAAAAKMPCNAKLIDASSQTFPVDIVRGGDSHASRTPWHAAPRACMHAYSPFPLRLHARPPAPASARGSRPSIPRELKGAVPSFIHTDRVPAACTAGRRPRHGAGRAFLACMLTGQAAPCPPTRGVAGNARGRGGKGGRSPARVFHPCPQFQEQGVCQVRRPGVDLTPRLCQVGRPAVDGATGTLFFFLQNMWRQLLVAGAALAAARPNVLVSSAQREAKSIK